MSHKDEAVEAAAKAVERARYAGVVRFGRSDVARIPGTSEEIAEAALTAAAPIIRADERQRVIAEIQASDLGAPIKLNPDGTARFLTGPELRERICAFIAERNGK